jgi:hypothetical protein
MPVANQENYCWHQTGVVRISVVTSNAYSLPTQLPRDVRPRERQGAGARDLNARCDENRTICAGGAIVGIPFSDFCIWDDSRTATPRIQSTKDITPKKFDLVSRLSEQATATPTGPCDSPQLRRTRKARQAHVSSSQPSQILLAEKQFTRNLGLLQDPIGEINSFQPGSPTDE